MHTRTHTPFPSKQKKLQGEKPSLLKTGNMPGSDTIEPFLQGEGSEWTIMVLRIAQQTLQKENHKHTSEMTTQPLQSVPKDIHVIN